MTRNKKMHLSYILIFLLFWCFQAAAHSKQQYVDELLTGLDQKHSHEDDDDFEHTGISKNFYSFTAEDIHGNIVDLSKYAGKVALVVNVASECGYTDGHYRALVQLQQTLGTAKFTVLAFPCNQFGNQEPGENWQIQSFAEKIYKINFPLFAKIDVLGDNVPESWKFLIGTSGEEPNWNFWKYLVNEHGVALNAWGPQTSFSEIYKQIKEAIEKPRVNDHLRSDL